MDKQNIVDLLNVDGMEERLAALRKLAEDADKMAELFPPAGNDVNNHIHTKYSFSPYSPTAAVFKSKEAGLATCGIMDHDSAAGSAEFSAAGRILNIPTTQGCELRVSFAGTFLEKDRINNPDQNGVAYMALHGIPDTALDAVAEFLAPIRAARLQRNRSMVERLNELVNRADLALDFDRDILAASWYKDGGEITERHLLYALANKIIALLGKGPQLCAFLTDELNLQLSASMYGMLSDAENPHYDYDLLGLFKGYYVSSFYVDATDECPHISELAEFAHKHNIVLAYPYLGDVTASVTGDKAAQTFEDAYLDQLFVLLKELNVKAITYMPSRNTSEQLQRLMKLCRDFDFFQISGEDINQPRQKFVCAAMRSPEFAHLEDAAWALIGHERLASADAEQAMFSGASLAKYPDLDGRVAYYAAYAKSLYKI